MNDLAPKNGDAKQVPALVIAWDSETQTVQLQFSPQDFKTWDFVLMVLEGAKLWAEDKRRLSIMNQMAQASAEAAQAQTLMRKLHR